MKTLRHLLVALCAFTLALTFTSATTGCSTAPSARVQAVQTLGVLGSSAKAGMDSATQLLAQGSITVAQWQKVADFYDHRWQPAYALAVTAARSDLGSIASPDVTNLAVQLLALVASLTPTPH
jgi:hypothetical protein